MGMNSLVKFLIGVVVLLCSIGMVTASITGLDSPDSGTSIGADTGGAPKAGVAVSVSVGSSDVAESNFLRGRDGTYVVGAANGVAAGTYQTVNVSSYGCYWARLSGLSGELKDVLANEMVNKGGMATVQVVDTDRALQVKGCGKWVRI